MVLPSFRSLGARRRGEVEKPPPANGHVTNGTVGREVNSERTLTPTSTPRVNLKRATRQRKLWIGISCFCFFVATIFLILVLIGNLNNKSVLRSTYFFYLDLSNIIPETTPDSAVLVNSLARSLGLHDFYQVGLWNFCEGYNDEGITYCSPHETLYWFNPVSILINELLAGATITLPNEINNILDLIKVASHFMYAFFLTGVCMNFVNIFLAPIALYSRWWSFPLAVWIFISTLLTVAATVIATVMFIIFRNVITSQDGINIGAHVGTQMFAFMWVAAAFSLFGWSIHLGLACCCASRRDVKTGRRKGSKKAYGDADMGEKKGKKKRWGSSLFSSRGKSEAESV